MTDQAPVSSSGSDAAGGRPGAEGPLQPRSCMGAALALVGALMGSLYLLNPGWGVFELLPDNLPGVGNLDEAGATALVIFALRYLFTRRR